LGNRARAVWPALLTLSVLMAGTATAAENFQFSTNEPDKQFDYFQPSPRGQKLLDNVEKGHLVPGIRQLRQGDLRHAHNSLDFVLRWYPNHPRALNLYSKLAMKRQRPDSALPYFDHAVQFGPDDISTRILYGIHRYRMGDYRKAVERFNQALAIKPDYAEAHYNLGLTFLKLDAPQKALQHAKRAYDQGYPLPGLREKLRARGAWQASRAGQAGP